MALELLISDDIDEAFRFYSQLEVSNSERKLIQKDVYDEAVEIAHNKNNAADEEPLFTLVYKSDWHEGVIGIVASKLVETFKTPALVFADASDEGVMPALDLLERLISLNA